MEGLTVGKTNLAELSLIDQLEYYRIIDLKYYYKYDENDKYQECVRRIAKSYLSKYKFPDFEQLHQDEKNKIGLIVDTLIDENLMEEKGLFSHSDEMFIEQANNLGLKVKNYETELPNIYKDINEFDQLCNEHAWVIPVVMDYVIYTRLITDIPKIENLPPKRVSKK
jgi:hypothetical protein